MDFIQSKSQSSSSSSSSSSETVTPVDENDSLAYHHQNTLHVMSGQNNLIVSISENTFMCDGIGGIVWEGSLLLIDLLRGLDMSGLRVLELGKSKSDLVLSTVN